MQGFLKSLSDKDSFNTKPINSNSVEKANQPIQTIIERWNRTGDKKDTETILKYLQPTIKSALHTYVPGQQQAFKIKATKIALQSMRSYDKKRATKPQTYAFVNLQRLNRIRRDRDTLIHIPESQVYLKATIDKKVQDLTDTLGRQPTEEEISDATGISKKKLEKLNNFTTFSQSSTINPQNNQSSFSISDVTDRDYYNYVYSSLGAIDKKILELSSPLKGTPLSNNEIAKRLKLSPGAISQRKQKIQQLMGTVRSIL